MKHVPIPPFFIVIKCKFLLFSLVYSNIILNFAARINKTVIIMEAKKNTFEHRTPEEVRAWFYRAKARIAAREEEIRAMYKEEQRMKAERKHVYDLETV
jgi:hypothetical protein